MMMMMMTVDIHSYCPHCCRSQRSGCDWMQQMAAVSQDSTWSGVSPGCGIGGLSGHSWCCKDLLRDDCGCSICCPFGDHCWAWHSISSARLHVYASTSTCGWSDSSTYPALPSAFHEPAVCQWGFDERCQVSSPIPTQLHCCAESLSISCHLLGVEPCAYASCSTVIWAQHPHLLTVQPVSWLYWYWRLFYFSSPPRFPFPDCAWSLVFFLPARGCSASWHTWSTCGPVSSGYSMGSRPAVINILRPLVGHDQQIPEDRRSQRWYMSVLRGEWPLQCPTVFLDLFVEPRLTHISDWQQFTEWPLLTCPTYWSVCGT